MAAKGDRALEWEASIGTGQLDQDAKTIESTFERITAASKREGDEMVKNILRVAEAQSKANGERLIATINLKERLSQLNKLQAVSPSDDITAAIKIAETQLEVLLKKGTTAFNSLDESAKKVAATVSSIGAGATVSVKPNTAIKSNIEQVGINEQAALQKELEESRLAYQKLREEKQAYLAQQNKNKLSAQSSKEELLRLKVAEQELNNQYRAGRIALQEFHLEQKKLVQAQKEAAKQQRETAIAAKEALKVNRDQSSQVKATIKNLESEVDILQKLQRESKIYQKGIAGTTNIDLQNKYNQKLQETLRIIQQFTPRKVATIVTPSISSTGVKQDIEQQVKVVGRLGEGWKKSAAEQIGAIERVKAQLKTLREAALKATPAALPKLNKEIEATEQELKRLNTVGRTTFQETDREANKVVGTLNRLKRAAELYKQASAGTNNVELQTKYNRKLQETEQAIQRTTNIGKVGFDEMGNKIRQSSGSLSSFANSAKGLLTTLGVVFGVQQVIQFASELFTLTKKAEGVELAFARIGDTKQLEQLRVQTKGTVSDLQLMQAAVKANNFKIPMDILGKGLAFAQARAKDTGQEVDYLVESLVNGIGRKSKLILDNLGISTIELQAEFQKTGDFATAVGNIIDREMERSGQSVDGLTEKTGSMAAMWENAKTKVGGFFRNYFDASAVDTSAVAKITEKIRESIGESFSTMSRGEIMNSIKELSQQRRVLLSEQRKIEREIENGDAGIGTKFRQKQIKEELTGINNVNNALKETLRARQEEQRVANNRLSVTEMQAKVENLRKEASERIIFGESDKDFIKQKVKEADELQAQIDKILGKGIEKREKKEADSYQESLNKRIALLSQIGKVEDEYSRKSLDRNAEEKQAISDRFNLLREQIEKFNKSVQGALKIDIAIVDPIEKMAFETFDAEKEVEKLKDSISQQKQLFEKYEQFKTEYGDKKARERFQGELAEYESYIGYLNSLMPAESDQSILANKQREFLKKEIEQAKKDARTEEFDRSMEHLNRVLEATKTARAQELKIEEQYLKDLEALRKEYADNPDEFNKRKERLESEKNDAISAAYDAEIKRTAIYKQATEQLFKFTREGAKTQIAAIKEVLKNDKLSNEERKNLRLKLLALEEDLALATANSIGQTADALRELAGLVGKFDKQLANTISNVANLAQGVGAIVGGVASGNPFAVISGGIGALTALYDLFDSSDEKRAAAEAKQQASLEKTQRAIESVNRVLEQQARIIDRALGTDKIAAYRNQLKRITSDIVNTINRINQVELKIPGSRGLVDFNANLKNLMDTIGGGGRPDRGGGASGPISTLETINEVLEANRATINGLYTALENGSIHGNVEELKELIASYEQLEQQLEDYRSKLREVVTGVTFVSIVDSIADGFKQGLSSAEIFAKSFEEMLRNAVIQSLKMQALEKPLKAFYEKFAEYSESDGSLDAKEIEELTLLYQGIIDNAGKQFDQLKQLSGVNIGAGATPTSPDKQGLAGAIRGITEQQAELLAGQFNAIRLHVASIEEAVNQKATTNPILAAALEKVGLMKESNSIALNSMQSLIRIDANTAAISASNAVAVQRLTEMLSVSTDQASSLRSLDRKTVNWRETLTANGWK